MSMFPYHFRYHFGGKDLVYLPFIENSNLVPSASSPAWAPPSQGRGPENALFIQFTALLNT